MPPIALIVNDEPATSSQLAAFVGELGYETVLKDTGAGALAAVREHQPDVILLDLTLPDATGFEICHKLKCDRETNLIPVILVALKDDPRQVLSGLRVGSNGYIAKPYTRQEIKDAIDAAHAWRHERVEHGDHGEITFTLRSEMTFLQETNDLLTNLFSHTPLTERQIKELKQVITEMGGNAIEWGPQERRTAAEDRLSDWCRPRQADHHRPGPGLRPAQPAARRQRRRPDPAPGRAQRTRYPRRRLRHHAGQGHGGRVQI